MALVTLFEVLDKFGFNVCCLYCSNLEESLLAIFDLINFFRKVKFANSPGNWLLFYTEIKNLN